MWKEYFGAGSHIVGIDIDPACKEHQSEDIEIHIGSQDDPNLIDHVVVENGVIDVVIDDGSHMMEHMLRTFNLLYDRISPNGVYFWSRIPTPVTGLTIRVGCVSLARSWNSRKLDEIHAVHTKGAIDISDFTRSTRSITVYDSVCVFEKAPQGRRQAPITDTMSS
jgi:hypothetical protein